MVYLYKKCLGVTNMRFIDLFAGAGGLSEGFLRQGFEPVAHIEMNLYASQTLMTRTAYYHLKNVGKLDIYTKYLKEEITREELLACLPYKIEDIVINKEITDESINQIFNTIDSNLNKTSGGKIDVLIGGPPCQAYSLVGRARDPYGKERDPRNYLYKQYVKFLKKYKPELFVFENVPGILSAAKGNLFEDVKRYMEEVGYEIEPRLLNAADFGVMQRRKRVILIGWKKGRGNLYPNFQAQEHHFSVDDILCDLPHLEPGEENNEYASTPTKYLKKYHIRERSDILTHHVTRPNNVRDREIYRYAINLWNNEKRRLKYTELPESLITHKNLFSFLDRFKVVGANLPYSHTVVAHIAKDGHYYIHPDINQARSLSVREAARLQSFPDNFFFEGPRTANFTQIGNAVPPLMAEQIAVKIKQMLINEK